MSDAPPRAGRWLADAEVARLTGKKRYTAQVRELTRRRIRWTPGGRGEPLVAVGDDHDGSADIDTRRQSARQSGPRWDRIG